jgi:diaminopimelate epimerase
LDFIKAQALGNDFVIIDAIDLNQPLPELSKKLADRHYGIGCDQVIFVVGEQVRFFNADGSEAEACGNGSRCVAKYLMEQRNVESITLSTLGGDLFAKRANNGEITIAMQKPTWEILDPSQFPNIDCQFALSVSVGNPHLVFFVNDIKQVQHRGEELEHHPLFPNRVNVGFAEVVSRSQLNLQVWERGVGLTLACGSGACAAAVAGSVTGLTEGNVCVVQPGGALSIVLDGSGELFMTGLAEIVFRGCVDLAAITSARQ